MSCDNSIPVLDIVDQVRDVLAQEFITRDNPNITNGVFMEPALTSPSITGDILLDTAARTALRAATKPIVVPKVIGSRADGTALFSLIQALVLIGLVVDNTTT